MGLIDELLGRAADEVTASRRERRETRQKLRVDLVVRLRDYSSQVERVRIALMNLRGELRNRGSDEGRLFQARAAAVDTLSELEGAHAQESEQEVLREILAAPSSFEGINNGISPLILERYGLTSHDSVAVDSYMQRQSPTGDQPDRIEVLISGARFAALALDEDWAKLRPVLDDALSAEAVLLLRAHRHDLRHVLETALRATNETTSMNSPVKAQAIDDELTTAIDFLDGWNHRVSDVRREST